MDLFEKIAGEYINLLPYDGEVNYYGTLLSLDDADEYLNRLINDVEWKNDEVVVLGKRIVTKRKTAWYGDKAYKYTYSNVTKQALPWNAGLLKLKKIIEQHSGETFNACLLNLYHNGSEGMTWHSDAEKDLKKFAAIGSLSFGAERKFSFKHKNTKDKTSLVLQHGSLLVMKGTTQSHWLHCLPTTKKTNLPRVNLTFRSMASDIPDL